MNKQKFIVIEGLDGCGKTTQFELLKENLKDTYKSISFPDYKSSTGDIIKKEYLSGMLFKNDIPDQKIRDTYAISALYALNRYLAFRDNCLEYYNDGGNIIASRYTSSNIIYQGCKLGKSPIETGDYKTWKNTLMSYVDWLFDFEYNKLGLPRPTTTILYHMPIEISQKLLEKRYENNEDKKDIHERDIEYLKACEEVALDIGRELNWKIIHCTDKEGKILDIDTIYNKTLDIINR